MYVICICILSLRWLYLYMTKNCDQINSTHICSEPRVSTLRWLLNKNIYIFNKKAATEYVRTKRINTRTEVKAKWNNEQNKYLLEQNVISSLNVSLEEKNQSLLESLLTPPRSTGILEKTR